MDQQIPRYALYGETARNDLGLVHLQALFSNIECQNWEIRPHRHSGLHQFVVLNSGVIEATIEGKDTTLVGPVVASIPTNCVHGFGYSPNAAGHVITVAEELMMPLAKNSPTPSTYYWLHEACLIPLSAARSIAGQRLNQCLDIIDFELGRRDIGAFDAIFAAVHILLVTLSRARAGGLVRQRSEVSNHYQKVGRKFQDLAANHYREHWSISKYTEQIGVTSKQLSRVCQAQFGQSPLEYIHDLLNREAQRRLIYTNASVTEIGYDLGFKDPSYFSRFFRRENKVSPSQFANSKRKTK